MSGDPFVDAEKDYLDARARAELLKEAWQKLGCALFWRSVRRGSRCRTRC